MNILKLKELKEEATVATLRIAQGETKEQIIKSIEYLSKKGLRHNFKNGKTYLGKEIIASHVNKDWLKFENYDDLLDAIEWELSYEILNQIAVWENQKMKP